MSDTQDLERLIAQGIKSFKDDPPDSDYQRGYLAALKELLEDAGILVPSGTRSRITDPRG
jgi:hypothetical protein